MRHRMPRRADQAGSITPLALALGRGARLPRARRPVSFTPASKPLEGGARGERSATRRSCSLALRLPRPRSRHARTGFLFSARRASRSTLSRTSRNFVTTLGICALAASRITTSVLHAQVPGEVRGRITDAQSGHAIAGARIELVDRTVYALSDVGGAFALRGPEPGAFALRIRALGYVPRDTEIVITNGRATTIDIAMTAAVSRLDAIVVRAERDSANALSFNRQTIEQSGRRDLGELLQSAPGVVITRAGGPGSPSHISIRGSGASEVLVIVDGSPINSAITGEADLSSIGLETVERVRVLPGAQSARYGGRALAGVVIIETRRTEGEASGAASVGAWGERNGSLVLGRTHVLNAEQVAGSIEADYRDVRGDFSYAVPAVRGGGTARRVNGDARSVGVLASAAIGGADDQTSGLRMRGEWHTQTRGLPGSIVQPSTTGRQHETRVAGGADGRWSFRRLVWTANADGTHERSLIADPSPPFGSVYDDAIDANSLTIGTSATVGASNRSFAIGSDARALDVTSTMLAPNAPRRQQQWGTWASARALHTAAGGTDLDADLSARGDWDSLLSGAVLSPRAAVSATRGPGTVSASFGGAFTPPSLTDQFFHEGVLVRPNPDLRPERVRREIEVRAGLRDTRVGAFTVGGDAAAYRADIDGMILWLPNFQFIWSPANFDVQRNGWEASGRVAVPSLAADVHGSLSRSDVTYLGRALGGQVAYRPRTTANVAAAVARWSIRAEMNARYVGARRTVAGSDLNVLDPYWLSDVSVARPIASSSWQLDVTVGVENVFDRSASMLADYPFPGRTWTFGFRTRHR